MSSLAEKVMEITTVTMSQNRKDRKQTVDSAVKNVLMEFICNNADKYHIVEEKKWAEYKALTEGNVILYGNAYYLFFSTKSDGRDERLEGISYMEIIESLNRLGVDVRRPAKRCFELQLRKDVNQDIELVFMAANRTVSKYREEILESANNIYEELIRSIQDNDFTTLDIGLVCVSKKNVYAEDSNVMEALNGMLSNDGLSATYTDEGFRISVN